MNEYKAYNSSIKKITFPDKNVVTKGVKLNVLSGIDYVCMGREEGDMFVVSKAYQLCHAIFSVKKVLNPDTKKGYYYATVNIIEYQFGKEIPHTKNMLIEGHFFNLYPEAEFEAFGYWKHVNGKQETFVLVEHKELLDSSTKTIYNYIKHITKGHRYSDKNVNEIIKRYDIHAIEAIKKTDAGLLRIFKNPKRLSLLQSLFITNKEQEDAFKYLLENEIASAAIIKVLEKFGNTSLITIKSNPYAIFGFSGISLKTLDDMAYKEKHAYNNPDRIEAMINSYFSVKTIKFGDVYVDFEEFVSGAANEASIINSIIKHTVFVGEVTNKEVLDVLNTMVSKGQLIIQDNLEQPGKKVLYKKFHFKQEEFIVSKIKDILASPPLNYILDSEIDTFISSVPKISLHKHQLEAVKTALQHQISILTGGPGTGKTQTIKMIVETLLRYKPMASIELCAPTGRASRRMSEVIGMPASTIHKKLNYIPFENSADQELTEIDCDLLIIDETSMIDIDLFFNLLKNVSERTSILIVGDYNQIPSVGPGLILRDLINSGVVPFINLTKVFRQGKNSSIIDVSNEILAKNTDKIFKTPKRGQFRYVSSKNDEHTLDMIIELVKNAIKNLSNPITELQILTPMNNGLLGTLGLNKNLQNIFNPPSSTKEEIYVSPTKIFREGDKVIQTKNNYDLKVFNGSIGIIDYISYNTGTVMVDYDGDTIEYKFDDLSELNLAYAITVHKSQGSEFDYVILPVSNNHLVVSNKNLLYTALTRAKKGIVVIGTDDSLVSAINKEESYSKKSQIKLKLR